ncbi:olfactory receptor 5B17-like [Monodelphis domestica]|uniref:olfactory receptor 5B17-like n=1 Tax=Monodelphis domestica TaxID=13616 RepID=UPI0024E1A75E|nr:olfactory receptor 5B17-like [Monodelphis domestica]
MENRSKVNSFILLGLTETPVFQGSLFIIVSLIYLITLVGNLGMVALISHDSCLHTPMYFFLRNLSLVDFGLSSTIIPKVMTGLLTGDMVISYNGCATQLFFFVAFAGIESFLLAFMAYDRHAAVCRPLHYATTMTSKMIIKWILLISRYIFSYLLIFITILKIRSANGRQKAFSTCASHLTAVFIFYGTCTFMYFQPSSSYSMDSDKMVSVFYTMVIPMLNPLIYSLRNKEVKNAFRKAIRRQCLQFDYAF